ncbi:Alpha-D-glucose-1-phosphate phosphatase YihX [Streptococcus sanguinis]|uniref:HAD family hydrolase n=1 Tax=Streptococcus sanguinis TaxID=1305 RepID=UPI000FBF04AC|nr:HAD family phosphatase [Streptococcus sanguinis]RSI44140.1 Alpha-D-glucose-1-phosphate phosphatase YihX [Streptococcus sanguinis]RSI65002.1 Alpha-D-glucose-1-phosphate phosphatase YihX [Streptococcus sanguinis]
MIKNLVFDLGNVLIEWNSEKNLTYFEPEKERRQVLRQAIFESGVWHQTDKGELSLKDACEEVLAQLDVSYHSAVKNIFYHWYEVVHVYSGLQERIRLWANQGYRIYILSTTCEIFYHIEKAGLLLIYPLLSGYILSSEVGVVKPEVEIYRKLLKKYGLDSVESVFIDDIQANLDTAAELGFETILSTSETENIRAMETLLAAKGKFS